jgi:hypothetical protein
MKLRKHNFSNIKTPVFIKNTGLILLAAGMLYSCNDGNKKEDNDLGIEESLEVENDSLDDNSYTETNAVADYLIYMDREGKYEEMEEPKPEKALQKFAAAVSERSQDFGMEANEELQKLGDSLKARTGDMKAQLETAVMELEKLQKNSYEELSEEVEELKAELKEIDTKAEDSKEQLRAFFNKAAAVMDDMDARESENNTMSRNPGATGSMSQEADTVKVNE